MTAPNAPPIAYTVFPLDRAPLQRRDAAWLAAARADPATRLLPVWRGKNLIHPGTDLGAARIKGASAAAFWALGGEAIFLGTDAGGAWFALDVSEREEPELAPLIAACAPGAGFMELRPASPLLEAGEAAVLAAARGLAHWHRSSRFCGACGAPTASRDGGHARRCEDDRCGRDHFPRTDPAVIMLLTIPAPPGRPGDGRCLLARQPHWPDALYSALAGFVEPGESLEAAVRREAMEEVGVALARVIYRASQPWPFPSSLMVGFRAEAAGDIIRRDETELADARWFSRAELRALPKDDLKLSRVDSIARFLIEEWLAEEG